MSLIYISQSIHCIFYSLVATSVKPNFNMFFITNFMPLEMRASLVLQFSNSSLSPTNITLSSKHGMFNFYNRIIRVPLTIKYMEDYTITFRNNVCGEEFVEGNISIINCLTEEIFIISLQLNDNYTYLCSDSISNVISCIKVTSSEINCTSGNYTLKVKLGYNEGIKLSILL